MNAYQALYKRLFDLIMARSGTPETPEFSEVRREMDRMPPHGRNGDDLKAAWGREIGGQLYDRAIYGK